MAYRVVDSRAFGLPQRRRRVYFLASKEGDPRSVLFADDAGHARSAATSAASPAASTGPKACGASAGQSMLCRPSKVGSTIGIPSAPAIIFPDGRVGMPHIRDAERLQGFRRTGPKAAQGVTRGSVRWKLVGNAVTVQAAEWLGRRMAKPGRVLNFLLSQSPAFARGRLPPGMSGTGARWCTPQSGPCSVSTVRSHPS